MHFQTELPKFYASFTVKLDNSPVQVFTYEGQIPEKIMDAYQRVAGDGLAKVTVSADFGMKDFGSGVSSMAAITLTCGQNEQQIREAAQLAGELAREFAHQNAAQAISQIPELMAQAKQVMAQAQLQAMGANPGGPNYRR